MDLCVFHLVTPQRQQMRSLQLSAHRGGGRCCLRWSSLCSSSPPLMLPPGCPELSDGGLFMLPASPAASPAHHCAACCRAGLENVSQIKDGNAKCYAQQYHWAQVPLGSKPCFVQTNDREDTKHKTHNLRILLKTAAVLLWPFLLMCPVTLQSVSISFWLYLH